MSVGATNNLVVRDRRTGKFYEFTPEDLTWVSKTIEADDSITYIAELEVLEEKLIWRVIVEDSDIYMIDSHVVPTEIVGIVLDYDFSVTSEKTGEIDETVASQKPVKSYEPDFPIAEQMIRWFTANYILESENIKNNVANFISEPTYEILSNYWTDSKRAITLAMAILDPGGNSLWVRRTDEQGTVLTQGHWDHVRILYIDDDEENARHFEYVLSESKHRNQCMVEHIRGQKRELRTVRKQPFDIVFTSFEPDLIGGAPNYSSYWPDATAVGVVSKADSVDLDEAFANWGFDDLIDLALDLREIDRVIDAFRGGKYIKPITAPENKSASVSPIWKNGKIYPSSANAEAGIPREISIANLLALKEEMNDLVLSAELSPNLDARPAKFIGATSSLIGNGELNSITLFKLIRREAVLLKYEETVRSQWPTFLAAQYSAMCTELGDVLGTFAECRIFRRHAVEAEVENVDFDQFTQEFSSVTVAMRKNTEIIDVSVPNTIDEIGREEHLDDEGAKNLIKVDQLESANNVLKELFRAIGDKELAEHAMNEIEKSYGEGLLKGVLAGAKEAGTEDGKKIGATVARARLAKEASHRLSERFPKLFGWIGRYFKQTK